MKWLCELLEPTILSRDAVVRSSTPHVSVRGTDDTYGLAQYVSAYRGRTVTYHLGAHPGQFSIVRLDLSGGLKIAVMMNWKDSIDWTLCRRMTEVILTDVDPAPQLATPSDMIGASPTAPADREYKAYLAYLDDFDSYIRHLLPPGIQHARPPPPRPVDRSPSDP